MDNTLMRRLEGKIAVIIASTSGIGLAIAKRLAQEGAHVIISSRKQENVDNAVSKLTSEGLKVTGFVCHASKAEDRKHLLNEAEKLGGIDILVSNAGTNPAVGDVLKCPEKAWDKIFELNLKATFLLVQEAVPLIKKRGGGKIIFISSSSAFHPFSKLGVYGISKAAMLSLAKVLAVELALDNITVNSVAPGVIKTDFANDILKNEELRINAFRIMAMCRYGTPEEVSGIVAFLASNDASYITGEVISPTGGVLSRL